MSRRLRLTTCLCMVLSFPTSMLYGQTERLTKSEVAPQFTLMQLTPFGETRLGFGFRYGFDLDKSLSLEGAVNFLPADESLLEGLLGIKLGKRVGKFGFFGKAGGGISSFSHIATGQRPCSDPAGHPNQCAIYSQVTGPAAYFGGGWEIELSPRRVMRFDVADTLILSFRHPRATPDHSTHNFQFTVGYGFRF